jgi:proteasome lid subunit RPN8/RPN11
MIMASVSAERYEPLEPLVLSMAAHDAMVGYATAGLPHEVAGALGAGRSGIVTAVVPLGGTRATADAIDVTAADLDAALTGLGRAGLHLAAIYHSHPGFPARPSAADRRGLAASPAPIAVIVGLDGPAPRVTAWRPVPGSWHPDRIPLKVLPPGG